MCVVLQRYLGKGARWRAPVASPRLVAHSGIEPLCANRPYRRSITRRTFGRLHPPFRETSLSAKPHRPGVCRHGPAPRFRPWRRLGVGKGLKPSVSGIHASYVSQLAICMRSGVSPFPRSTLRMTRVPIRRLPMRPSSELRASGVRTRICPVP